METQDLLKRKRPSLHTYRLLPTVLKTHSQVIFEIQLCITQICSSIREVVKHMSKANLAY